MARITRAVSADARRELKLNRLGYRVVRVSAELVRRAIAAALGSCVERSEAAAVAAPQPPWLFIGSPERKPR
jgi:very-short-patch-repair endonuclease